MRDFCPSEVFHCKLKHQACSSAQCRSSTANSGTKVAILLGTKRCGSFLLLSAPHSLFSIRTGLKRSEKIPRAPLWRWGEWIWLTGPSGLHRNSPRGLNISSIRVFDQIRDKKITITLENEHTTEKIELIVNIGSHIFSNVYQDCKKWNSSPRVVQRASSRDEMWWSPYIEKRWIARMLVDHAYHYKGGCWNEMKEIDVCGEMVEWNLWWEKTGKTLRKT